MNTDLALRLQAFDRQSAWFKHIWSGLCKAVKSPYKLHLLCIEIGESDDLEDDSAYVEFHEDSGLFVVAIDPRMPMGMAIDFLVHELSHVGTWWVNEPEDHGPMFGVEYARLYRRYLELYDEFWNQDVET